MKILYAVRMFSGLESSLREGRWQPTGVPTIYRMIEALDRGPDSVIFVLACKDDNVTWPERRDRTLTLNGLRHNLRALAGKRRMPRALGPLAGPLREVAHARAIARLYRRERPDLVYLDHANVFVAGWLALTTRARIAFRVMGVYPVMRAALAGRGLRLRLLRWCYGQRFTLVVCTQDGSGVEIWLDRALSPDVARVVMVNGCDPVRPASDAGPVDAPAGRTIVLFLGKLDPAKGPVEFADGFLDAWRADPGRLHAVMIGTGSESATVRARFTAAGATDALTLVDRLPHDQVMAVLMRADIYVSLNRFGNLSNANLEAMQCGKAMIVPRAQPDLGIDVATDRLLPPDSALRIESTDDIAGLSAAILRLHRDLGERARRGAAAGAAAGAFVESWDRRIDREIELLRRAAEARLPGVATGRAPSPEPL